MWARVVAAIVVLVATWGAWVWAQDAGRAYSMATCGVSENRAGGPSDARFADQHTVFWSSEGTAWPTYHVYLTLFNPTWQDQVVKVTLIPDASAPVMTEILVPAGRRRAVLANEVFAQAGLGGRVNFATRVWWPTVGAVSMASWEWDGVALSHVVYNTLVQGCEAPAWANPYGLGW
jgi:hypothetical protein